MTGRECAEKAASAALLLFHSVKLIPLGKLNEQFKKSCRFTL